MTLTEASRTVSRKMKSAHRRYFVVGAGTINLAGSDEPNQLVETVLSYDGFAVDSANIAGDFAVAVERANISA